MFSFSFTCNGHWGPEINENGSWNAAKYKRFGLTADPLWKLECMNVVKYDGLDCRQHSGITHCRYLWGLECCKTQWRGVQLAFWNHSLQIRSGSYSTVKYNSQRGSAAGLVTARVSSQHALTLFPLRVV